MQKIKDELTYLKTNNMFRRISAIEMKEDEYVVVEGKKLVNFSSNDYLGLSTDKFLVKEFCNKYIDSSEFCFSSASARLLSGTSEIYGTLETTVAKLFGKDSALIFNTGYQCNLGVVSTLAGKGDVIFCDKLNHASIIDGMRLSEAAFYRYHHLDYENLEKLLQKHRNNYNRALIISESLFSMDGDVANIDKLVELKKKYDAILMIDEAHAFASIDDNFAGLSDHCDVDVITATFGKAVASFGAFAVANKEIIEYLTNKARSFIFSTSIPPVNIMWTNWLLTEKADYLEQKREKLSDLIIRTHKYLKTTGLKTVSESQIIPIILETPTKAENIAKKLLEYGYFVLPIRPPSVPVGTSRLRLSLTANMEFEQVKKLFDIIQNEI